MSSSQSSDSKPEAPGKDDKPRSARHVRAAAKILKKEARKILSKHGKRIAAEPAEAIRASLGSIDALWEAEDIGALETEAEKLDELLHQHASFARKSALRETLENIGIAVLIALGLRSCFYEPFKIPSSSMMPTLRTGDHIFVNKFTYGIQIPFTSTVVGESLGHIERGDVVVFRYPLDPTEDFIKRVIGLPGDEVRVMGRIVSLKRPGEDSFEVLERNRLDQKCYEDDYKRVVAGCQLFEETIGDKTYTVRYMTSLAERKDFLPKARTWKVPEGHLLVMGDNRNQSHDSLQWTVRVEAVDATGVITDKDLRDLTDEKLFTQTRPTELGELSDPSHDHVTWLSTHRSRAHDLSLAVWRKPQLGAEAMFEALAARMDAAEESSVATLVEGKRVPTGEELERTLKVGASIDRLLVGRSEEGWHAIALLEENEAVLELQCGRKVCKNSGRLAARLTDAVGQFRDNEEKASRELLARPPSVDYGTRWTGRSDVRDHYYERRLSNPSAPEGTAEVRLRVFRKPKQSVDVLQDAALRAVGTSAAEAPLAPSMGERAWLVEGEQSFRFVATDDVRDMVVVLDCGRAACKNAAEALALATVVQDRVPKAASDRRKLKQMLQVQDLQGSEGSWTEDKVLQPPRNPFDRTRLEATVQGRDHSLELEVWTKPEVGLPAKVAEVGGTLGLATSDAVAAGGLAGSDDEAFTHVFAVPSSQSVIRMRCRIGLCPDTDVALAVARRAAQKASDPTSFIDPDAERPQPFVPRGNVKGRAERIWLPFERFWLRID